MLALIVFVVGIVSFFIWDIIEGRPPNDLGFIFTSGPESQRGKWTIKAKLFLLWIILFILAIIITISSS